MFGMEFLELVDFVRQVGLALAGAASLWGLVFLLVARKANISDDKKVILSWVGERLILLLAGGVLLAVSAWFLIIMSLPVFGHEGVTIYPSMAEKLAAFQLTFPIYILWIVLSLGALVFYGLKREVFLRYLPFFFGLSFVLASFLISLYAWTSELFSANQIFFYFHGFHSIMTVGTVLTLDFLFLSTRKSLAIQSVIFPFFPQISKVIWVGLALDFLSVALVFDEALQLVPRFFLAQTVVSILIINGAFLSGPLTRKLLDRIKEGINPLSGSWGKVAAVCGSISIVSWLTITFIDFFPNITLSYIQMLGIYISAIIVAYLVNLIVDRFDLGVAREPAGLAKN